MVKKIRNQTIDRKVRVNFKSQDQIENNAKGFEIYMLEGYGSLLLRKSYIAIFSALYNLIWIFKHILVQ